MALQAGRVGLNKDVVDEFGYLKSDAPTGEYYTKTQADNKFETKTHVNNTFQKKTLEVPIELLQGSALTVESALQGLNEEKQNIQLSVPIDMLSGSKLTVESALNGLNEEKFDKADEKVLGAYNVIKYPYKNKGVYTDSGITFTDNGDGSITISGVATAIAYFTLANKDVNNSIKAGKYTLKGGLSTAIRLEMQLTNNTVVNNGGDTEFTVNSDYVFSGSKAFYVRIANGTDLTTPVTIYPMLIPIGGLDTNDFVSPTLTNRDITEELMVQESAVTDIVTGATTTTNKLYKQGNVVQMILYINEVTASSSDVLAVIPSGYRPKSEIVIPVRNTNGIMFCDVKQNGNLVTKNELASLNCQICATWIV